MPKLAPAISSRLDRTAFLKPIAHRGLHNASAGIVENTAPAFEAALARGYGMECDLRPASGGLPVVFHDETLDRLIDGSGPVADLGRQHLKKLRYRDCTTPIITFADLLDLVGGREPLLVEIKSEWEPLQRDFLKQVTDLASVYKGPLALMSFDPEVMSAIRHLSPAIPRGVVSGIYRSDDPGDDWWGDKLTPERSFALSHLLLSEPVAADFYAYHVKALPTPVTRYVREVQGLPLFTWTVRSAEDRAAASQWADAPIFEGSI